MSASAHSPPYLGRGYTVVEEPGMYESFSGGGNVGGKISTI